MLHIFFLLISLTAVAEMALPMSIRAPDPVTSDSRAMDDASVDVTNSTVILANLARGNIASHEQRGTPEGQAHDGPIPKVTWPDSGSDPSLKGIYVTRDLAAQANEKPLNEVTRELLAFVGASTVKIDEKWKMLEKKKGDSELVMKKIVEKAVAWRIPQNDYNCLDRFLHTKSGVCNDTASIHISNPNLLVEIGRLARCLDTVIKSKYLSLAARKDQLAFSLGIIYVQDADPQYWERLASSREHNFDTRLFLDHYSLLGRRKINKYPIREYEDLFDGLITDSEIRRKMGEELIGFKIFKSADFKEQSNKIIKKFSSDMERGLQRTGDTTMAICYALRYVPKMSKRIGDKLLAMKAFDFDKLFQGFNNLCVDKLVTRTLLRMITGLGYNKSHHELIEYGCESATDRKSLADMENKWDLCKPLKNRFYELIDDIPDVLAMAVDTRIPVLFLRIISTEVFLLRITLQRIKESPFGAEYPFAMSHLLNSISPLWIGSGKLADYKTVKSWLRGLPSIQNELLKTYNEFLHNVVEATNHKPDGLPNLIQPRHQDQGANDSLWRLVEDMKQTLNNGENLEAWKDRVDGIGWDLDLGLEKRDKNDNKMMKNIVKEHISDELTEAPLYLPDFNTLECEWNRVEVDKSKDGLLKAYFQAFINTMTSDVDDFSRNKYFATRRAHSVEVFLRLLKADKRFSEFVSSLKQEFEKRKVGWQTVASTLEGEVRKFDIK